MAMVGYRNLLQAFIITSFFSITAHAAVDDTPVKVKWGYKGNIGPHYWGQLDPSFAVCAEGKSQSPINIPKKVMSANVELKINYNPAPMVIMDDGATQLEIGKHQTVVNTGHGIQLNFPAGHLKESITFAGKNYRLVQFHFHSPSESEWHDRAFPLEIHFVHQGADGKLAVIGVFVKGGKANPTIQKIVEHLPPYESKEYVISGEQVDPMTLLPAKWDYYHFLGSLTTPPCSEGVQWMVMADTITASPAQIAQLKKAAGGANARPVQPLRDRKIEFVMSQKG